jgi:hypothetical protein
MHLSEQSYLTHTGVLYNMQIALCLWAGQILLPNGSIEKRNAIKNGLLFSLFTFQATLKKIDCTNSLHVHVVFMVHWHITGSLECQW